MDEPIGNFIVPLIQVARKRHLMLLHLYSEEYLEDWYDEIDEVFERQFSQYAYEKHQEVVDFLGLEQNARAACLANLPEREGLFLWLSARAMALQTYNRLMNALEIASMCEIGLVDVVGQLDQSDQEVHTLLEMRDLLFYQGHDQR